MSPKGGLLKWITSFILSMVFKDYFLVRILAIIFLSVGLFWGLLIAPTDYKQGML